MPPIATPLLLWKFAAVGRMIRRVIEGESWPPTICRFVPEWTAVADGDDEIGATGSDARLNGYDVIGAGQGMGGE